MFRRCEVVGIGVMLSLAIATASPAQGCAGCTISITKVATLRAPEDSTGFSTFSHVSVDGRGRIVIGPLAEPGRLHVFDANGAYVRTIGRAGSGPGEFQRIGQVSAIPGDSTLVFDYGNAKMTVLDPSYRVAREVRLQGVVSDAIRLRDGTLIAVGSMSPRKRQFDPFFVIGDSGIVKSFGQGADTTRDALPRRSRRAIAPARGGGFWAGHANEYRIDHVDVGADPSVVVRRDVPWFPKWTESTNAYVWVKRPNPALFDVREDDQGLLWTFLGLPADDWKPATNVAPRRVPGVPVLAPVLPLNETAKYWQRVIEVIDPHTGNVLASIRPSETLGSPVGRDMTIRMHETPDGDLEFILYRLALVRPR